MKPNIYASELNTERIATYRKLAEDYKIEEGTVRDIFCKGAEWGIEIADRYSQYPTYICGSTIPNSQIAQPEITPDKCDHPVNKRSYYEGGSSWCNKCWSYVDIPPHGNFKNETRTVKYKGFWYGIGDKIRIGWKTYKVCFIGYDGGAVLKRKWGKEKQICGDVNIELE
jgi:hypothetical protein